ncbi:hypothetical protein RRG08_022287 [Elysia crispata]|uniref:Uncharacterized protein n=1 Tax=Elysia crispata TaxID=231223 RepID=A0AAE1DLA2_9GAST|nr:hypothetical protein RRG08_022287 [Elysia crispata]
MCPWIEISWSYVPGCDHGHNNQPGMCPPRHPSADHVPEDACRETHNRTVLEVRSRVTPRFAPLTEAVNTLCDHHCSEEAAGVRPVQLTPCGTFPMILGTDPGKDKSPTSFHSAMSEIDRASHGDQTISTHRRGPPITGTVVRERQPGLASVSTCTGC